MRYYVDLSNVTIGEFKRPKSQRGYAYEVPKQTDRPYVTSDEVFEGGGNLTGLVEIDSRETTYATLKGREISIDQISECWGGQVSIYLY